MISLNYRDSRPIYEQIRDGLRKLIVTGALSADEKLPSVRALAAQLAINPNTIQRAITSWRARDTSTRSPARKLRRRERGGGLRPPGGAADPGAGAPLRAAVSRGKPAGAAESGEGGESVMIEVNGW